MAEKRHRRKKKPLLLLRLLRWQWKKIASPLSFRKKKKRGKNGGQVTRRQHFLIYIPVSGLRTSRKGEGEGTEALRELVPDDIFARKRTFTPSPAGLRRGKKKRTDLTFSKGDTNSAKCPFSGRLRRRQSRSTTMRRTRGQKVFEKRGGCLATPRRTEERGRPARARSIVLQQRGGKRKKKAP